MRVEIVLVNHDVSPPPIGPPEFVHRLPPSPDSLYETQLNDAGSNPVAGSWGSESELSPVRKLRLRRTLLARSLGVAGVLT